MKSLYKSIMFAVVLVAMAAVYYGCTKGPNIKSYSYPAPEPKDLYPTSGYAGIDVTINGAQFGDYKNVVKVFFNGIQADTIRSTEDGKIIVKVPANAISGKVSLQVWTTTIDSIGSFTVDPYPTIKSADPLTGLPGDTVRIYGTGYGTDLAKVKVKFNGTLADIAELVDTMITTTVPVGATSGNITVTVNDYTVTGPGYSMLVSVPAPVYELDFEDNLNDKISGVAAVYNQGAAAAMSYDNGISGRAVRLPGYSAAAWTNAGTISILPVSVAKQKEITVSCWVNWASGRNTMQDAIFDFGEIRGTRITLVARMSGNWNSSNGAMVGRFLLQGKIPVAAPANYEDYVFGKVISPATWTHVAMTISFSGHYIKIYQNGALTATKNLSNIEADPSLANINRATIGGASYGSTTEPAFGGLIDKFQIFNTSLSADQIYTLYFKK